MKLIVLGNPKQKKNDKRIAYNKKTKKPFIMTGSKTNDYISSAISQLREQFVGYKVTRYPITVSMKFYYGTRHRKDIDNSCSTILDCMKEAGVIEDDGFQFVNKLVVEYGGLDKENPRTEIHLDD